MDSPYVYIDINGEYEVIFDIHTENVKQLDKYTLDINGTILEFRDEVELVV